MRSWLTMMVVVVGCGSPMDPLVDSDDVGGAGGGSTAGTGGGGSDSSVTAGNTSSSATVGGGGGTGGSTQVEEGALLWLVDGETGALQALDSPHDGLATNLCTMNADASLFVDNAEVRAGDGAITAHIQQDWLWGPGNGCNKKIRAFFNNKELVAIEENQAIWMGWTVMIPSDYALPAASYTTVNFHGPGGTPPQFRVSLEGDTWRLTSKPGLADGAEWAAAAGVWHEFVVQASFTADPAQGVFKLWHKQAADADWTVVIDHQGQTAEDTAEFPFHARFGIIKGDPPWSDPAPSRTLYFDEIRLGSASSSFEEVAPNSGFALPSGSL